MNLCFTNSSAAELGILPEHHNQGDQACRIAGKLKKHKNENFSSVLSQLVLKYAYTLEVLIHQFVHMEFSDGTLQIF